MVEKLSERDCRKSIAIVTVPGIWEITTSRGSAVVAVHFLSQGQWEHQGSYAASPVAVCVLCLVAGRLHQLFSVMERLIGIEGRCTWSKS